MVEQVFAVKGIGKLLFEAISNRDFSTCKRESRCTAHFFVVIISLIVDLIAKKIDPRMAKV